MEKLTLIKIRNPFSRTDRDIVPVAYQRGQSLLDIRNEHFPAVASPSSLVGPCRLSSDTTVSVNGRLVPQAELAVTYPMAGDQILFVPVVHGGDNGIMRTVMMIVVAAVASYVAGPAGFGFAQGTFGYAVAMGATMLVGGMLVNALLPPPKPELPTLDSLDNSPTYSWNPQTTQRQGIPIPKFYGVNRLYGNIITAYLSSDGAKQFYNALIGLGRGPMKRIYDTKINDQPTDSFQGVLPAVYRGELNETRDAPFNETKTEYALFILINQGVSYTYTTIGSAFDRLEVEVSFPSGLWFLNTLGQIDYHECHVRISIRKQGTVPWRAITRSAGSFIESASNYWSLGKWTHIFVFSDSPAMTVWTEYLAGSNNPYDHIEGDLEQYDDPEYFWHWIGSPIFIVVSSNDYYPFTSNQTTLFRRSFFAYNLEQGVYEIKVEKVWTDPQKSLFTHKDDLYLTAVREVANDFFEYPLLAKVGIKALATDQLSGSIRFSCMAECSFVRYWDGSNWLYDASDNPAWCAWDVLTQPVIQTKKGTSLEAGYEYFSSSLGLSFKVARYDGKAPAKLDLNAWKDWADFCDALVPDGNGGTEKRITFNGGFDTASSTWEVAQQIAQVGRAIIVPTGDGYTVAVDKPGTPVQLFTVGNIGLDTFKETFLKKADRASSLTMDFIDRDSRYERNTFTVMLPDIPGSNSASMPLVGCTRRSEAWRHGMYRLYNNLYVSRAAEIAVGIDAIACQKGDLINVQHDVPQWGFGGRIARPSPNLIVGAHASGDTSIGFGTDRVDSVISVSSDFAWQGTQSIKLTPGTSGIFDIYIGLFEGYFLQTLATEYTASCLVRRDDGGPISLSDISSVPIYTTADPNAWPAPSSVTHVGGGWYRVVGTRTGLLGTGGLTLIGLIFSFAGECMGHTMYFDGWQVELGDHATDWMPPNSVELDQQVAIENGKTYTIMVRLTNDTVLTRSVVNAVGTTSVIEVSSPFSPVPVQYDLYAFGETGKVVKPFRVLNIRKTQEQECTLSLIEYNESVYGADSGVPVLPTQNYSSLEALPAVTNLLLDELLVSKQDGTIEDVIDVYFTRPASAMYREVEIWYANGGGWIYAGSTTADSFRIHGVRENLSYLVAVVTVNLAGDKMKLQNAPQATIDTLGKTAPPSNVVGFTAAPDKADIRLSWTQVPDADRWAYELRLGASWDAGTPIVSEYTADVFSWKPTQSGTLHFWIKAIDTSGIYSATATEAVLTIQAPSAVTGITKQVVDNNILLKWTGNAGTFPIENYEVRKGATYGTSELIGLFKGTFCAIFETQAGDFTYWIKAIDSSGLYGPAASVTATMAQPPDFVLLNSTDDFFTGTKTNIAYDAGDNCFYGPVDSTQTFDQYSATLGGTTMQDFIDAGTKLIEPGVTTGQYVKTFDFLTTLASSSIIVTLTSEALIGTVTVTPKIETSPDNSAWTAYPGVWEAFGINFRYVRVTLDLAGAGGANILKLINLGIKLNVKKVYDGGSDTVSNATNGKVVRFNKDYVDIVSIGITPKATTMRAGIYNFRDAISTTVAGSTTTQLNLATGHGANWAVNDWVRVPLPTGVEYTQVQSISTDNPTVSPALSAAPGSGVSLYPASFVAYLFDSAGTKVTGDFSWDVSGVE